MGLSPHAAPHARCVSSVKVGSHEQWPHDLCDWLEGSGLRVCECPALAQGAVHVAGWVQRFVLQEGTCKSVVGAAWAAHCLSARLSARPATSCISATSAGE